MGTRLSGMAQRGDYSAQPGPAQMHRFQTRLVSGRKRPYTTWTFLIVPAALATTWGAGQQPVRGTISGHAFRGTASRGEGALRVPVPRELRESAGLKRGDTVTVELELDTDARAVQIPDELRAVFGHDPEVAALYDDLPPAHRRAWAAYVSEAKRPATRALRAGKAPDGIRARAFPR